MTPRRALLLILGVAGIVADVVACCHDPVACCALGPLWCARAEALQDTDGGPP